MILNILRLFQVNFKHLGLEQVNPTRWPQFLSNYYEFLSHSQLFLLNPAYEIGLTFFFFFGKILHSFYSVSDFVNFSKKIRAVSHCVDWERPTQLYQGPALPIFSGLFNFRVVFYLSTKRFCMWIKVCLHKEIYRYVIRPRICLWQNLTHK